MLRVDGKDYYSTKEAAARLGLTQSAIQDAIWRGALAATRFPDIPHRTFVAAGDLDCYATERHGSRGWQMRKAPDYVPNGKRREYQRAYRQRKRQEAAPATSNAAAQEGTS